MVFTLNYGGNSSPLVFMAELNVMSSTVTILFLLALVLCSPADAVFNIADYGAKSDGQKDSSQALLSAWQAACGSSSAATVYVPAGSFLVRRAQFSGPCKSSKIMFHIDGTLVAPSGYGTAGEWLLFDHVQGVTVYGGTIDGRGSSLWACKAAGHHCPTGAYSLVFRNSRSITISGVTSVNSEKYHMVIDNCEGATIQGVRITAPGNSPNTDGIHVEKSSHVTITGAGIKTGDDCISIGPGSTNLWIEQVNCGPGHGISIGSLGQGYDEAGVENVTVKTTVFTGTQNGLRIKTWGRPSEGFVKGLVFDHAVMQNAQNPIIIDQNYCPGDRGCPDGSSGVKISEVTYSDIHGSSASQVAVKLSCSPSNPCTGIGLQDIKLMYGNMPAESSCQHADGSASGFVVPPSCL